MAGFLDLILQQMAGQVQPQLPADVAPMGSDQTDLVVSGGQRPQFNTQEGPELGIPLGNAGTVDKIRNVNAQTEIPPGLFGVHGKGQNLLGILGDAFLTQAGQKTRYAPWKLNQELSKSMAGFTENPLAALERATAVDPDYGAKVWNQYGDNEYKRQMGESQIGLRDAQKAKYESDLRNTRRNSAARLFEGAKDEASLALMKDVIRRNAQTDGWDLAELGYDLDGINMANKDAISNGDMTVYQSKGLDQRKENSDRSYELGKERNATSRISATRPRAGRAPTKTTTGDRKLDIASAVRNGTATEADLDELEIITGKEVSRKVRRKVSGGSAAKPKSGGKLIIRGGKVIRE